MNKTEVKTLQIQLKREISICHHLCSDFAIFSGAKSNVCWAQQNCVRVATEVTGSYGGE